MKKVFFYLSMLCSVLNAQTLSDSFKNGYTEGKLELFFYDIDKTTNTKDAHATALGGYLSYETDTSQLFYGSLKFHTSNPIFSSKNIKSTALFNNDKNGAALNTISESYLAYKGKNRVIKLGNMILNTPLMNEDTTRIVPWSYQGFAYKGTSTKHTTVQLYYINAIRSHTAQNYTQESASGSIGSKGLTMLSFYYKNKTKLKAQAYYYYAPELYSTFFTQLDYSLNFQEQYLFCFGAQYFKSGNGGKYNDRENKNGGDDINLIAAKISMDADEWTASLSYSQNFGLSGIVKAYGGLAKVYTTSMVANGRGNYKPETWMLKLDYHLPIKSVESNVALWLTDTKVHDTRGDAFKAYYLHYRHFFTKEASAYLRYEHINYEKPTSDDVSYLRLITSYKF
jgi:hypothetical protein